MQFLWNIAHWMWEGIVLFHAYDAILFSTFLWICLGYLNFFHNYCIDEGSVINCKKSTDLRLNSCSGKWFLPFSEGTVFRRVSSFFLFYILIAMFHNGGSKLESKLHFWGLSLGFLLCIRVLEGLNHQLTLATAFRVCSVICLVLWFLLFFSLFLSIDHL